MSIGTIEVLTLNEILIYNEYEGITKAKDVKSFVILYFMDECDMTSCDAHKELYSMRQGADGAMYREEDHDGMVLVRYSLS